MGISARSFMACLAVATLGCGSGSIYGALDDGRADAGGADGAELPRDEDGGATGPDASSPDVALSVVSPDRTVIGGLSLVLDGSGSIGSEFQWQQISGPNLAISDASDLQARISIPAGAPSGTNYTFRLTVSSPDGGATDFADTAITVAAASFSVFLDAADVDDNEGIAFSNDQLWVVSKDFVDRFSPAGVRLERVNFSGIAAGANLANDGQLVLARYSLSRVVTMNLTTKALTTVMTGVTNANYPLPDRDGNIYPSTRASNTVLRYDAASQSTATFVSNASITNPNALAFGPESNMLYVGASNGVYRVPINADGTAGTPALYVATDSEVDGLIFDDSGNLYVGCPNTKELFVVPYATGLSTPTRTFTNVGAGYSYFVNPVFGQGLFGETTLYYTNLSGDTVGRINVGCRAWCHPSRHSLTR